MGNKQSTGPERVSSLDELEKKLQDSNATPMSLPLEFLKAITCNFSTDSVLGEGGYGVVYKGVLRNGKIIAVKKLFEIHLKEEAFQNEVRYLMGIKHHNVVQFVGYCAESSWEAIEQPSGSGRLIFAEMPKRLLCFEYLPNQSLDKHISDASMSLEWNMRYEIIKGVCNGLHFLHDECRIVHLDLKPENILMDSTMTPKIADFGLSRIFGEQQSRVVTDNPTGTCGYMAPEYLIRGVVSNKADIFSLGVIFIEIITGRRDYPYFQEDSPHCTATSLLQFTENVVGSWRIFFECTPKYKTMEIYTQQVRQCITIALKCVDPSMENRPSAKDIVQMLDAVDQVTARSSMLLDVQPLELCFPIEPNKLISCSLHLTNNKDKQVLYRLMEKKNNATCSLRLPICGIVPSGSTYILIVTMGTKENLPEEKEVDLILRTSIIDEYITDFHAHEWRTYFEKAKMLENGMHTMALKASYSSQRNNTCEIISAEKTWEKRIYSLDFSRTEPWILTVQHDGFIDIWNYDTKKSIGSVQTTSHVLRVKFIERKEWFIAGSMDGFIRVYNYKAGVKKIVSFRAGKAHDLAVTSLAVHPTKPYVLSACGKSIKLWDWDKNWECIQTYEEQFNYTFHAIFNPKDTNSFASPSHDSTVKIWRLDSLTPKYTLSGHSSHVECLDFFTRDHHQYLITGSDDKTAKIWDMQTKVCMYTIEGFMSRVTSVVLHPSIPALITGAEDGAIRVCSSTSFRLKRIVKIGENGIWDIHLIGPRRVMIAQDSVLWMMEIHDEEADAI